MRYSKTILIAVLFFIPALAFALTTVPWVRNGTTEYPSFINDFIGVGTSTPGSLFSIGGIANFTAATSTFYSSGGLNMAGGCYAINGTCITGGGVTSIGPVGQTSSGPAVTLATTTSTTNGFTSTLTITGSGNTQTFVPSLSGTLTVAGGGTGATSFTAGSIPYSNGTILTENNASLFWDNTNTRQYIGFNSGGTGRLALKGIGNVQQPIMSAFNAAGTQTLELRNNGHLGLGASVFSNGTFLTLGGTLRFTDPGDSLTVDSGLTGNLGGLRFCATDSVTTIPNGSCFQIFGTGATSFPGQIFFDTGAHDSAALIFRSATTSGNITERMRITAQGNFGFGTSSPFKVFTIVNPAAATTTIVHGDPTHPSCDQYYSPNGTAYRTFMSNAGAAITEAGICQ